MKVTRADWAGSVPWSGITGKPASLQGSAPADLTELTARIETLEKAVASLTSHSTESTVTTFHVEWTIDSLEPLQPAYEDVTIVGVRASSTCSLLPQDPTPFLQGSAIAIGPSLVRLSILNLAPAPLTPGLTVWTLVVING